MAFGMKEKAMLEKLEDLERQLAAMKMEAMGSEGEPESVDMGSMTEGGESMAEQEYLEEPEMDPEAEELRSYMKDEREQDPNRPAGIMIAVGSAKKKDNPGHHGKKRGRKKGY